MSVERVLGVVLRDAPFFRRSGGGVTLGGGEPAGQPEFARSLLEACRRYGLDTAIETCGYAETRSFLSVAMAANHVFFDVKHAESSRHRELTGVANELILDNLRALLHVHAQVTVRYPLVPGCNDGGDDLRSLARRLLSLPRVPRIEIVPYHRFGEHKYRLLGRPYALEGTPACDEQGSQQACTILQQHGISCSALVH
jgi:pyruvate formate lyase activating enzyme